MEQAVGADALMLGQLDRQPGLHRRRRHNKMLGFQGLQRIGRWLMARPQHFFQQNLNALTLYHMNGHLSRLPRAQTIKP